MQRIKGLAPSNFKPQVDDTEKRLSLLFDLLNNDDLKAEHIAKLKELAEALARRDFETATALHTELMKLLDQQGPWVVSFLSVSSVISYFVIWGFCDFCFAEMRRIEYYGSDDADDYFLV